MGSMNVPGFADARFGPVRECFAGIVTAQPGTGAAFAAWHDGQLVVDLWGGYADAERRRPWVADSLVQPYSVSKPFAAVCALRLVEDGRLDLDAPVQRYWPEFRAAATVRHVLSHQAGVVTIDRQVPTEAFYDWDYLCGLLAAQQPSWPPGTAHGESALFYGHLVGELVRRVDGRTVGRFLREVICVPFGIDFAFGLDPAQQARAVDITGLDDSFRAAGEAGRPPLYRLAVANPPGAQDGSVVNSAAWRAAEIPAINGHGTARAVAGFYEALASGRLLSPGMLAEAVTPQCSGPDRVFGGDNAWGLGFGVEADGYGMGGLGGSYGGASTAGGYTVGFVTGSAGGHDRGDAVENAFRECLGIPPLAADGDPPLPG
jgi:CubicO group peptidase (beta-lactamase class C family)